jgi:general secretion pathway protein L
VTTKGQALFSSFRSAINWLVEGLMEAWVTVQERLSPRQRLLLVRSNDGYALQRPDGQIVLARLPLDGPSEAFPSEAAALVKDGDLDMVLPAEELLVRTLEPLPAQSKPYLDGIVRHQLERLTPWRVSDVLYSYQAVVAGPEDSRLNVTMAATTRSLHRRRIEQLSALQPHSLRLVYRNALEGKDVAIDVTGNAGAIRHTQHMRRTLGWSAAGLGVVSLLAIVLLTMTWQNAEATLEATEREVADLRAKLSSAGPAMSRSDRDVAAVFERRLNTPFAVTALDALSESLPDDTYLTEFRLSDGRVRMTGVSQSVSKLVPLLEASPSFAEATFFAPTARLPNSGGDRFHLDAKLIPPGARKQ